MWDVLYTIDSSSSMAEASRQGGGFVKIEAVKQAITDVVKSAPFPYGSRVGVVAFRAPTKAMGTMVDSKQPMVQKTLALTPVADLVAKPTILRDSLDSILVGGATPTGEGLRTAVDLLHAEPEEGHKRIKKVMLVTDEKSNVGPKPDAILDVRLVRRAIVDVIAIGAVQDRKSFEILAARTGGRFGVVNDQEELKGALDPRIPYAATPEKSPLLEEANRVIPVLQATGRGAVSYEGLLAAARAVRLRLEQKVQDVILLEGQARVTSIW